MLLCNVIFITILKVHILLFFYQDILFSYKVILYENKTFVIKAIYNLFYSYRKSIKNQHSHLK